MLPAPPISLPSFSPAPAFSRRRFLRASAALLALPFAKRATSALEAETPPEPFEFDKSWPAFAPEIYPERCQIAGVAVAQNGEILALNRGENSWNPKGGFKGFKRELIRKPAVLVIDPVHGGIVGSWGRDLFFMPHQISVDPSGNIWIVDCGQNKVFKFDPSGQLLLTLGGARAAFDMPTDVAFLSDGRLVISDGYVNTRLVLCDPNGKPLTEWGTRGDGPRQFKTPHSVAVDPEDRIYVADRENHRIQVLNTRGEVLAIWTNVERPLTVRFQGNSLYVLSNLDAPKGIVRQLNTRGEIVAVCPTRPLDSEEDFEWPHGLAVSADQSTLYVGYTLLARRVQRFRRKAPAASGS